MIVIGVPSTIQVASIGIPDTLFLMLLALVVFGPRRLPEIGRQIGKLMYEFRKVSNDFKYQMEEELRASEEAARQEKLQAAATQVTLEAPALPVPDAEPAPVVLGLESGTTFVEPSYSVGTIEDEAVTASIPGIPETTAEVIPEVEIAPAVAGEVRGEPRRFPPVIQPPVSGEIVEAQRPFRGRVAEKAAADTSEAEVQSEESQADPVEPERDVHHA